MEPVEAFLSRWSNCGGKERENYQSFLIDLAALVGADRPEPAAGREVIYGFEKSVRVVSDAGVDTTNFIDLYRADCFVLEAKQYTAGGSIRRGTQGWRNAMQSAYGQARKYAQNLPGKRVPVLITVDIGHQIDVWTDFSREGRWPGYAGAESYPLARLSDPAVRERLRALLTEPMTLDPALRAERVTREVAARLAALTRSLEADRHDPRLVADFVMRCLFTMFAEDVGLLDKAVFSRRLEGEWCDQPHLFPSQLKMLWDGMDRGGPFWGGRLPQFNGRLFKGAEALSLNADQITLLSDAALCDWSDVEPAIFGTLLERALDGAERARLGAHFTPRAYIERLVQPALIEPLREEWTVTQAAVHGLLAGAPADQDLPAALRDEAVAALTRFHASLCQLRVLDPACGTGNFLYVSFALLKELEREVLAAIGQIGGATQEVGELARATVNPSQFLGLETNPRAVPIAELVLWIGYLQWWRRARPGQAPPEPILRAYDNIRRADAVLAWDGRPELVRDEAGAPRTAWDQRTYRVDPLTGREVPDESAQVPLYRYPNARPAEWPAADYIVGNPPFIGNKMMRARLGDGYVEALRAAWPEVPGSADLVMYWVERAADRVRRGEAQRFGLITTNSLTQPLNRGVLERHLRADPPLAVVWAVPDHPWVDVSDGAAVRIAMTVGARAAEGQRVRFAEVTAERDGGGDGVAAVALSVRDVRRVHADLSCGADVASARRLRANQGVSFQGVNLVGQGFRLTPDEVTALGFDLQALPAVLRPYQNARDVTQGGPPRYVIDFYGLSADEARDQWPALYDHLLRTVKPERDTNRRDSRRKNWWIFGEPVGRLRDAMRGLSRYILTPIVAKHRVFQFAPSSLMPDCKLYALTLGDGWLLAALSGRFHTVWSLATGSWHGVGNDPRWGNGPCFETFPFPALDDAHSTRLDALGERLDAHRKAVPGHLTAQYNALTRHREARAGGAPLKPRERDEHARLHTATLAELHDAIDAEVAAAYGWPVDLPDDLLLERLVALNAARAAEEAAGTVRGLRPDAQTHGDTAVQTALPEANDPDDDAEEAPRAPWPSAAAFTGREAGAHAREQVRVVLSALRALGAPADAEQIAARFHRAPRAEVRARLEALEHLGVLDRIDGDPPRWVVAG